MLRNKICDRIIIFTYVQLHVVHVTPTQTSVLDCEYWTERRLMHSVVYAAIRSDEQLTLKQTNEQTP